MDDTLIFYSLILLIGLILFFGIPFLIFFILKKLRKPKTGKIIGISVFVVFISTTIYISFEDYFFFKNSARKELKQVNLVLNDDFKIIKNESGGFTDYYHIFELKISDNDLERLIENQMNDTETITIIHQDIEKNSWKEVRINRKDNILIYEYTIN